MTSCALRSSTSPGMKLYLEASATKPRLLFPPLPVCPKIYRGIRNCCCCPNVSCLSSVLSIYPACNGRQKTKWVMTERRETTALHERPKLTPTAVITTTSSCCSCIAGPPGTFATIDCRSTDNCRLVGDHARTPDNTRQHTNGSRHMHPAQVESRAR